MSYDIRICVKIENFDDYAVVATPEYDSPTYNLGEMFRACTDWDYEQGKHYKCCDVIGKINKGITELRTRPYDYKKYEAENGWGTIGSAIEALESMRECIFETAEYIPIEHLYIRW